MDIGPPRPLSCHLTIPKPAVEWWRSARLRTCCFAEDMPSVRDSLAVFSPAWTSSSSFSSDIYRLHRPSAKCCSTPSAVSTNARQSSLPPISPLVNRRHVRRSQSDTRLRRKACLTGRPHLPGARGSATGRAKELRTVRHVYFARGQPVCRSARLDPLHHTHGPRREKGLHPARLETASQRRHAFAIAPGWT